MAKSMYMCECCGKAFDAYDNAMECEQDHVKPERVLDLYTTSKFNGMQWKQNPKLIYDKYPTVITVKMDDGARVIYKVASGDDRMIVRSASTAKDLKDEADKLFQELELLGSYMCNDCGREYNDPEWTHTCPDCGGQNRKSTNRYNKYCEVTNDL